MPCAGFFFASVFSRQSRLERGPDPLVLSLIIVNWLLNSSARYEQTFFQLQILFKCKF